MLPPTTLIAPPVVVKPFATFANKPVELATIPLFATAETVPVAVIVPPDKPLPVATDVTVPVVGVAQYVADAFDVRT